MITGIGMICTGVACFLLARLGKHQEDRVDDLEARIRRLERDNH